MYVWEECLQSKAWLSQTFRTRTVLNTYHTMVIAGPQPDVDDLAKKEDFLQRTCPPALEGVPSRCCLHQQLWWTVVELHTARAPPERIGKFVADRGPMRLVFTKPRFPMFCQELRQAGLRVNDDLTRSQQAERSSLNLDFHGVKSTSWEEKSRQNLSSCMIWCLSQMSHICRCAVDLLQSFTCLKFNTNWCITTSIRGEYNVTDKGTRPNRYGK